MDGWVSSEKRSGNNGVGILGRDGSICSCDILGVIKEDGSSSGVGEGEEPTTGGLKDEE